MNPTKDNLDLRYGGSTYSSSSMSPTTATGIIATPSSYPRLVVQPAPTTQTLKAEQTDSSSETSLETPSAEMSPVTSLVPAAEQTIAMFPTVDTPSPSSRPDTRSHAPTPSPTDRFSIFRLNRTALRITALVVSFMVLVGLSALAVTSLSAKPKTTTTQNNGQPSSQYAVSSLPLSGLNANSQLLLGKAEQLTVNGQLLVNNTLVLSPTTTPTSPVTGQLYYDKTTNQPYFYNGNQFIGLQPTTASQPTTNPATSSSTTTTATPTVTSLGASTGAITLGTGLSMTANQLDVATTLLNNLNATNLTTGSLADTRLSTNVPLLNTTQTFTAANTFSNTSNSFTGSGAGLTNLNATNLTTGTIANTRLSTNVTLQSNTFNGASQLVQTTLAGALPVISGANLTALNATNIISGTVADARLSTNVTVQGNTFNGASQLLQLTAGGILPTLSGANLTALNGTNVTSGTVVDARLSNNVTLQGNTFNGASQLVQLTVGGALPVVAGTNLTAINGTNITIGTVADARLSVNVALLNAASQFFTGNLRVGIASSTSTSMLLVNGVIESLAGLKLPTNASAPFVCVPAANGTVSLTLFFAACVCNGSSWVFASDGTTTCNWLPVPLIPTIGTASDTPSGRPYNNGLATVNFTPSAIGPAATSFTVTASPGGYTGTGTSSPITVAGLQSSVLYTFTVTATNANGTSNPSAVSNAITATTVPQAPTIGTATAGAISANVTFTDNSTGGSAITGHAATSSPSSLTGTGASPITITGLASGTAYTFTVTATNANGTSAASIASNSITPTVTITGGTLASDATYYYRTFLTSGTFGLSGTGSLTVDALIIGGGGGGGNSGGGGGGAGFVNMLSGHSTAIGNYTITIGAGGTGGTNNTTGNATIGGTSSALGTSSVGGGPGGGYQSAAPATGTFANGGGGGNGQSGGVSVSSTGNAGSVVIGGMTLNGYSGGGISPVTTGNMAGHGGAGASQNGLGSTGNYSVSTVSSTWFPGNGGSGTNVFSTWATATGTGVGGYYAGGGAGGYASGSNGATGGAGGGGGAPYPNASAVLAGVANTGGGGAGSGGATPDVGGAGGSGIVIIRYAKAQ